MSNRRISIIDAKVIASESWQYAENLVSLGLTSDAYLPVAFTRNNAGLITKELMKRVGFQFDSPEHITINEDGVAVIGYENTALLELLLRNENTQWSLMPSTLEPTVKVVDSTMQQTSSKLERSD